MPDNLSISISADTTKFRADLAVAQAQVREFGRQLKQAANEARVTGDQTAVLTLARQLDVATRSAAAFQKQLRAVHDEAARGSQWREAARGVSEVSKGFGGLSEIFGGLTKVLGKGGLWGVGIAATLAGLDELKNKIIEFADASHEAAKGVLELKDNAAALNLSTEELQRIQLAGMKKGLEDIIPLLSKTQKLLGEAQLEQTKLTGQMPGLPTVFRGGAYTTEQYRAQAAAGGPLVLRGGIADPYSQVAIRGGIQPPMQDVFQQLRLDPRNYFGAGGGLKFLQDAARELDKWPDTAQKAAIAEEIFQKKWREGITLFRNLGKEVGQAGKDITASGGYITEDTQKKAEEQVAHWATMAQAVTAAKQTVMLDIGQGMIPIIDKLTEETGKARGAWTEAIDAQRKAWRALQDDISQGIDAQQSAERFEGGWTAAFAGIASAWGKTVDFINSMQPTSPAGMMRSPAPGGAMTLPPYASGGQVPGSGSGDTVPAMLTPGEFVNRKSSVGYYGANLFRALNAQMIPRDAFRGWGYALGGLVDSIHRPTSHFAEGGMVESAGGRMVVDLHMGGQSFPMSSDREVANRLVRFARGESMRSAGIKPSWIS